MCRQSEFINRSGLVVLMKHRLNFCSICPAIYLSDCQLVGLNVCVCLCVLYRQHRCVCGGKKKQGKGVCFLLVWVCMWMRMTLHYWWVPWEIWEQSAVVQELAFSGYIALNSHIYSMLQLTQSRTIKVWKLIERNLKRLVDWVRKEQKVKLSLENSTRANANCGLFFPLFFLLFLYFSRSTYSQHGYCVC